MIKFYTIFLLFLLINIKDYSFAKILSDSLNSNSFSLVLLDDSIAIAKLGDVIEIAARITNLTNKDLYINIKRTEVYTPYGWSTQFCAKGCFPPEISFRTMYLAPQESDFFGVYVATNSNEGIGTIKFSFENRDNPEECYYQTFIIKSYNYNKVLNNKNENISLINKLFIKNHILYINFNQSEKDFIVLIYNSLGQILSTYLNSNNFFNEHITLELTESEDPFVLVTIICQKEIYTYGLIK